MHDVATDIDRARSALFWLPAGVTREDWAVLGMAAKDAGLAFDDFHKWSQDAANYGGEKDCRAAWKSFKQGTVTKEKLFSEARKAGWRDPATDRGGVIPQPRRALPPAPRRQEPEQHRYEPLSDSDRSLWNECRPLMGPALAYLRARHSQTVSE